MSMTLFFLGLILGVIFGWIGTSLLANFWLLLHGPVDDDLSRPGLSKALAQTPRIFSVKRPETVSPRFRANPGETGPRRTALKEGPPPATTRPPRQ